MKGIFKKNLSIFGKIPGIDNILDAAVEEVYKNQDKMYSTITALGGGNEAMKTKLIDAFKAHGYSAVFDVHDMVDGVSKLPVILLDKDKLTKKGQVMVGIL